MGTNGAQTIRPQSGPLERNRPNCTESAARATSAAKVIRPARESGVVFGSEIMKKAKISNAPLSI